MGDGSAFGESTAAVVGAVWSTGENMVGGGFGTAVLVGLALPGRAQAEAAIASATRARVVRLQEVRTTHGVSWEALLMLRGISAGRGRRGLRLIHTNILLISVLCGIGFRQNLPGGLGRRAVNDPRDPGPRVDILQLVESAMGAG